MNKILRNGAKISGFILFNVHHRRMRPRIGEWVRWIDTKYTITVRIHCRQITITSTHCPYTCNYTMCIIIDCLFGLLRFYWDRKYRLKLLLLLWHEKNKASMEFSLSSVNKCVFANTIADDTTDWVSHSPLPPLLPFGHFHCRSHTSAVEQHNNT